MKFKQNVSGVRDKIAVCGNVGIAVIHETLAARRTQER